MHCGILKLYEESGSWNGNRSKREKNQRRLDHVLNENSEGDLEDLYERRRKICKFLLSGVMWFERGF